MYFFCLIEKKVMRRIVKRFLLHKQRETDDQMNEIELVEIKQDLQMIRYEMVNELDRLHYETYRLVSHVANGIGLLGEHMFKPAAGGQRSETSDRFTREFLNFDLENIESPGKIRRTTTQRRLSTTTLSAATPYKSSPESVDGEQDGGGVSPELIELKGGHFMQINVIPPQVNDLDSIREESDNSESLEKIHQIMSTINESF
jgi:hypothetical protein